MTVIDQEETAPAAEPAGARRVLIVSASMGAGHDGAARELSRRLEARGHQTRIVDFLDMPPMGLGRFIRWTYKLQLQLAPWSYEALYRLWYVLPFLYGPLVALDSFLTRRAFQRAVREVDPDVVVSTYSLSSLVLGRMRKKGWLRVPVATYLTDFAVHPLWVHPSVDLNMAVSPVAAHAAAARSGGRASAPGPLVGEPFRTQRPDRWAARRALSLDPDVPAVLVVAGSWGVGDVISTVTAIAAAGRFHPITVCGRDEGLKTALEERGLGTVIGWTSEMPSLMAAADVLVENAGGLTCMEAFAAGLPVVTFSPIPGHGRDNAQTMAAAGVNRYAHDVDELHAALAELSAPGPARDELIARGRALFAGDAATEVVDLAHEQPLPAGVRAFRIPLRRRVPALSAAAMIMMYGSLTLGAQAVAAMGVGIARPPQASGSRAFVGARVTAADLADPAVTDLLVSTKVTVIVDARTAIIAGPQLAKLAAQGVEIANGGWGGQGKSLRWERARTDVAQAGDLIHRHSGFRVVDFAPGRRLDAFDQMWSRRRRERLVVPDAIIRPGRMPARLRAAKVYMLDGRRSDPDALRRTLVQFQGRLRTAGLTAAPLRQLR
jgi:UDP-N-acetylglucosamine:LPS N-acetylglucosamine transferase